jgi:hypothetical protein
MAGLPLLSELVQTTRFMSCLRILNRLSVDFIKGYEDGAQQQ